MLRSYVPAIPFWKLQAIGNDFPLFHAEDVANQNLSELAIRASDRKFGIGGDGILVMSNLGSNQVALRMFNPDGTEDFCGNGLRIAARHAFDQVWVNPVFIIIHGGKEIPAEVRGDGQIQTTIGQASYDPKVVPIDQTDELFDAFIAHIDGADWKGSSLTTGSTHTVIPAEQLPTDAEIASLGPQIEHLPMFPQRTSAIFVKEIAPMSLQIRIWERGVGETLGCGTGSSAAAADYLRRTSQSGTVLVKNPGGNVHVSMDSWDKAITVEGTAFQTYQGML